MIKKLSKKVQKTDEINTKKTTSAFLPDCMMPDGADPCKAYQQLDEKYTELKKDYQLMVKILRKAIDGLQFCDEQINRTINILYTEDENLESKQMRALNSLEQITINNSIRQLILALQKKELAEVSTHCVLQNWVTKLPLMQQTVLIGATRGPDGIAKFHNVKYLIRWYRRCVLKSSFDNQIIENPYEKGGGRFMGPSFNRSKRPGLSKVPHPKWETPMKEIVNDYLRSTDDLPHHYQCHMMHAIEICGYHHPNHRIRMFWNGLYLRLVNDLHLAPETKKQLDKRLGDDEDGWRERSDPATDEFGI